MTIRAIEKEDIPSVVNIHLDAFKNFFLTKLGPTFLNIYYSSFFKSEEGKIFGAFENNTLMGFGAVCYNSQGFNSKLIKDNLITYIPISLKLLFTKPNTLLRLIKNLSKRENTGAIKDDGDYAELMSIAVGKDSQGLGVGKAVLNEIEKYLKNKNIERLSLTTDKNDNAATINFYKKCGFSLFYSFVGYPDREMLRLIKKL